MTTGVPEGGVESSALGTGGRIGVRGAQQDACGPSTGSLAIEVIVSDDGQIRCN